MAAFFFMTAAPPGRPPLRDAATPPHALACTWRQDADGRLASRWLPAGR